MARHIIIGGGPAGVATAETIRSKKGSDAEITLISNEPVYSRMVLPYYLAKDIPEEHVLTGTTSYFEEHGIKSVTGQVEKIDSPSKSVTLNDGSSGQRHPGGVELGP